jgi:hypothetical protein
MTEVWSKQWQRYDINCGVMPNHAMNSVMNRTYGCAPVYGAGATLFCIGGGLCIYYGYPVIGAIILLPGLILLGLMFMAWVTLFRIKSGDVDVQIVVRDQEVTKPLNKPQRTRGQSKARKRKQR